MTKKDLLDILADLDLRPSRKLGQNFLIDTNMLEAIVRDAAPKPGETVLEVGPGTGVLTRKLLAAGTQVIAVEFDARLCHYLADTLGTDPALRLVHADACRVDYDTLMGQTPYRCVANLPYSCSSVFLARIMNTRNNPLDMVLLLQREMAERLAAKPGTGNYGALSVRLQLRYDIRILRRLPPQVFHPAPEVESAQVRLTRREPRMDPDVLATIDALARAAFQHRRKKALSTLGRLIPPQVLRPVFAKLNIPEDTRPEQLAATDFAALATCLHSQGIPYCRETTNCGDQH